MLRSRSRLVCTLLALTALASFLTVSMTRTHTLGQWLSKHEPFGSDRERKAVPPELSAPFNYPLDIRLQVQHKKTEPHTTFDVHEIELTNFVNLVGDASVLELEYYAPKKPKSSVVLIFPIMSSDYAIERFFARSLVRAGLAAIILKDGRKLSPHYTVSYFDDLLRQLVINARQTVDWIGTRPELESERIGILGLSLGGIRGAVLAAIDNRIDAAVLALVAGDLPYIISHSSEGLFVRLRDRMMLSKEWTVDEFQARIRSKLSGDPVRYAPYVSPKNTLLILARFDRAVPYEKGLELKEEMGNPETITVYAGHYTAIAYALYLRSAAVRFLKGRLE